MNRFARVRVTTAACLVWAIAFSIGCGPTGGGSGDAGDVGSDADVGDAHGAADVAPDGADVGDARADAADIGDAGADAFDGGDVGDADGGADGTPSDAGDSEAGASDAADTATSDSADVTTSHCGDGHRDLGEECDDGLTSGRRSCDSSCKVIDLLAIAAVVTADAGPPTAEHLLDLGRHPLSGDASGFGVVMIEPASPPRLSLTTFNGVGLASDVVTHFGSGSTVVLAANPVIAKIAGGRYVAGWTDFNGDGDELGVALQIVDPLSPTSAVPSHANATTSFSQYDPDLLLVGGEVVIAWVDDSSALTGADVKIRKFDAATLTATSAETSVAATSAVEGDVALAPFAGSYVIAWKSESAGLETLEVKAGTTTWSIGPYFPGPSTSRPALAELDATHLLVTYAAGDDGSGATYSLFVAVLDAAAPGVTSSALLAVSPGPDASAPDRRDPNLQRVGDRWFVAWRDAGVSGDSLGDEQWLKEVRWSGGALDLTDRELRLPRQAAHRAGDQRHPALTAVGMSLSAAWDDLGGGFGDAAGKTNVVVELIPLPLLRIGGS